jgi:hypothetical protein
VLSLLFLLIDLVVFNLLNQHVVFLTAVYAMYLIVDRIDFYKDYRWYMALLMFSLENFLIFDRFGIELIYLLPVALAAYHLKKALLQGRAIVLTAIIMGFFISEKMLIMPIFTDISLAWSVTILKISINLMLGYSALLGRLGNRWLSLVGSGRKVWTPNRKNAS